MGSMMISPGIQSVIFDFDYTLADSSEGVIECANYALGRLGLPAASDDDDTPYDRAVTAQHADGTGG